MLLSSAIVQEIKNFRNEFIAAKKEKNRHQPRCRDDCETCCRDAACRGFPLRVTVHCYVLQFIVGKRKQFF